jgi:hypothetical protein
MDRDGVVDPASALERASDVVREAVARELKRREAISTHEYDGRGQRVSWHIHRRHRRGRPRPEGLVPHRCNSDQ